MISVDPNVCSLSVWHDERARRGLLFVSGELCWSRWQEVACTQLNTRGLCRLSSVPPMCGLLATFPVLMLNVK